MIVEHKIFIGLRDVGIDNKVTNTALLSYLEDAGGVHSNIVGYGLFDIPNIKRSWVLLDWKIEIFDRPKYADVITVKTWSRGIDKLYAYRDFNILNENDEVIGVATSRWVLVDTVKGKIMRIPEEVGKLYTIEDKSAFGDYKFEKISEPKVYRNSVEFSINRSMIDVNNHLHNIYFMDIANEVLPIDIYKEKEFNNITVMYKKEVKYGDKVKVLHIVQDNENIIVIKSEDEKILHAILKIS